MPKQIKKLKPTEEEAAELQRKKAEQRAKEAETLVRVTETPEQIAAGQRNPQFTQQDIEAGLIQKSPALFHEELIRRTAEITGTTPKVTTKDLINAINQGAQSDEPILPLTPTEMQTGQPDVIEKPSAKAPTSQITNFQPSQTAGLQLEQPAAAQGSTEFLSYLPTIGFTRAMLARARGDETQAMEELNKTVTGTTIGVGLAASVVASGYFAAGTAATHLSVGTITGTAAAITGTLSSTFKLKQTLGTANTILSKSLTDMDALIKAVESGTMSYNEAEVYFDLYESDVYSAERSVKTITSIDILNWISGGKDTQIAFERARMLYIPERRAALIAASQTQRINQLRSGVK